MKWLVHPWGALAAGVLVFPLAKLLYLPNFVFNFLTTLVHECGHAACALLMGMPAVPAISPMGGGVTVWQPQVFLLALVPPAVLGGLAWRMRERKVLLGILLAAAAIDLVMAMTPLRETFAIAGGVLLEIVGAAACFFVCLAVPLERPFERPLYALWGWWMILNRGAETVLMLGDPAYRQSRAVIDSGLAAGLASDLHRIPARLGVGPETVLVFVLMGCILALPAAIGAWWLLRAVDAAEPPTAPGP